MSAHTGELGYARRSGRDQSKFVNRYYSVIAHTYSSAHMYYNYHSFCGIILWGVKNEHFNIFTIKGNLSLAY